MMMFVVIKSKAVESSVDLWMWRVRGGLPATEVWSGGYDGEEVAPVASCIFKTLLG